LARTIVAPLVSVREADKRILAGIANASDRLRFEPDQAKASEPSRQKHMFVGDGMAAYTWVVSGKWCVFRGTDFFVRSLPSEDEAKELIWMLVDRVDDSRWRDSLRP
jgi:hypothetical protein